jgi:hypothetical protein
MGAWLARSTPGSSGLGAPPAPPGRPPQAVTAATVSRRAMRNLGDRYETRRVLRFMKSIRMNWPSVMVFVK